MRDPKKRLIELIKKAAADAECSKAQTEQILALVKTTNEEGVPDLDDLKRRLAAIGG